MAQDKLKARSSGEKAAILREAKDRRKRCIAWESVCRPRQMADIKFAEGDSDNQYQWPDDIRTSRDTAKRPVVTINKTKQHILDVLNDSRQSRVSISIKATGGEATYEAAQVYMGVVRYIEYQSRAAAAYQHALSFAVRSGIGYWRVCTDYAGDDTFDQEIFIRPINDPDTVYLDPDIVQFDGSDARFGFITTQMPNDQFKLAYPKLWDSASKRPLVGNAELADGDSWVTEDHTVVAEYFRCVPADDQLIAYSGPEGQTVVIKRSEMERALFDSVIDDPTTKVRNIMGTKVEWFMIAGDQIIEEKEWPGRYIPIVRCVGEETVIQGQLDRKGLTRALKDAQRLFNYNASADTEFGALQSKTPYLAPQKAIENYEEVWKTANTDNHSFLPYDHVDDEGSPIPAPTRQQPPMGATAYAGGMDRAAEFMRMVSGQYQADMGAPGNERSGVAIQQRQRQGDNATYHYLDHQAIAIRFTGMIVLDLAPKIYDTERVVKMKAENGEEQDVHIDPNAPEAMMRQKTGDEAALIIFNPTIGKYGVESDVGPAYATKRQEAFAAYTQILTQNKELTGLIGDIALRNADFPGAEEAAQRLRRMVPKQALGEGETPDVTALKAQIAQMQKLLELATQKLADKAGAHQNDQEKNSIGAYKAQTERIAALKEALISDPDGVIALVRSVVDEAIATSGGIAPAVDANNPPIEPTAPGQGAIAA